MSIRKVSPAMAKRLRVYYRQRKLFLEGKRCAVFPTMVATEIHHLRGRISSLLTDERYWLPVSRAGHLWIDEHRKEAQDKGWLAGKGEWGKIEP